MKLFIILFILLVNLSHAQVDFKGKKPNIVYILTDDLGYGDVKVNNPNGKIKTPHLDKLAAQGMNFTDAHTNSSVCTPTRYGIMTGRYAWRTHLKNGVIMGYDQALIEDDRLTVGSFLQKQSYDTALIGKWHLGWDWTLKNGEKNVSTPNRWNILQSNANDENVDFSKPVTRGPDTNGGFSYYFSACGSLDMAPYVYVENNMPLSVPTKTTVSRTKYGWWRKGMTADDFKHDESTPEYMRRSIAYIKEKAKTDKPFFLYIPLPSPHTPILPTKPFQGKSAINPYADFVMQVDWTVGQIVKAIDDSGIGENTLIIFTSDNGCSPAAKINELKKKGHDPHPGLRGTKADIWEGGNRVPFIVRWQDQIKAGQTNDQLIGVTDLLATVADICNKELGKDQGNDSISMLPTFLNPKTKTRNDFIVHSVSGVFGLRLNKWSFIDGPGSGGWSKPKDKDAIKQGLPSVQLYNLATDLGQQNNLQAENPEKVKYMKDLLEKYKQQGYSK